MKILDFFKKKKCIIESESFFNVKYDLDFLYFTYESFINLPSNEKVKLYCEMPNNYKVNISLFFSDGQEYCKSIIISDIRNDIVHLGLIEIPEELRHKGLGTAVFKCWINILSYFENLNNIQFLKITGEVVDGAGLISQYSTKLYKKFNNYIFDNNKQLHLIKCDLNTAELEYIITRLDA